MQSYKTVHFAKDGHAGVDTIKGFISYKEYLQFYNNDVACYKTWLQSDFVSDWSKSVLMKKVAELLKTEMDLIQSNTETDKSLEPENPHPRIFPNGKCWQLFEHWRNEVKERTQLAELSFIYWQMQKDGLIDENIKPTEYRKWLLKTFDIDLDELKQLDNCKGGNKYPRYQTAKLLFKC